jgi:hypothetical protein
VSGENLPRPEELDAKIEALKEVLDLMNRVLEERIKTLTEAKEALLKAENLGVVHYQLPFKSGAERLYGWLEAKLREQEEKGHLQKLQIKVEGDHIDYSFKIVEKDDVKKVDGWFDWVKRKLGNG